MPGNLDKAFGIHEPALGLHSRRLELLASNLANADTPNYKARDIDFQAALREYAGTYEAAGPRRTDTRHLGSDGGIGGEPLYRVPNQPAVDGNTVDTQLEKTKYMEAALRYQASLDFLNGRIKSLRTAIKGE